MPLMVVTLPFCQFMVGLEVVIALRRLPSQNSQSENLMAKLSEIIHENNYPLIQIKRTRLNTALRT